MLLVAAAFVAGAACFAPEVPARMGAIAAAGAAASALVLCPSRGVAAAAAAAALCGAAVQAHAWHASTARLQAWDVAGGFAGEREVSGIVLASAETGSQGERVFPARIVSPGLPPLAVQIVVIRVPAEDAGRIDALRRGDGFTAWGRLRPPSEAPGVSVEQARRSLAARGFDALARVKSSRLVARSSAGAWSPAREIDGARAAAMRRLDRLFSDRPRARGLIGAMLLGERGLLADDDLQALRDSGLIHLISISGFHTGITLVALVALLRRLRVGPVALALLGACLLPAFALFVGEQASVLRACGGLGIVLVGRAAGRDVDGLASLGLATAALVAAWPPLIWSVGFELSVLATAGLLALGRPAAAYLPGPSLLRASLGVSLGAYLATAPLLALVFGREAPVSLLSNLAAGALCALCLAAGAAALALGSVAPLGAAIVAAASASSDLLVDTARLAARVPGGHVRVAAPPAALLLVYAALLVVAWAQPGSWPPPARRLAGLALALAVVALHVGPAPACRARVSVLDVGQGLAVVLESGDGRCLLFDAGPAGHGRPDAGDRIVVPALLARGCRRIEALILSHDHDDHAGGATSVLDGLEVGELWLGVGASQDPLSRALAAAAVRQGTAVVAVAAGDLRPRGGIALEVEHPARADRRRPMNDRCVVVRARFPSGADALLPGDIEAGAETEILARGARLSAGLLVAAHHGASGSNTEAFLASVRPQWFVVSCGRQNRFGHPGPAALARAVHVGASVMRTDRDGTVVLVPADHAWRLGQREGNGNEAEEEHREQQDGDDDPRRTERLSLPGEARVTAAEEEEDPEPERVGRDRTFDERLSGDEHRHGGDRRPGEHAVGPRRDCEHGVTSIELSDGEEVHRRHEQAHPCRAEHAVDLDLIGAVKRPLEHERDQRRAKLHAVEVGRGRYFRRPEHAGDEDRKRHDEPGNGTRRRDVEQGAARRNDPPDSDDRAERADEQGDPGEEERKRRRNAIAPAGEVVPHLVGHEDRQEQERIRQPGRDARRGVVFGIGERAREGSLPEPASGERGGDERRREQREMEPPTLGGLGLGERGRGGPPCLAEHFR
jgi:competence protein ComEC